MLTELYAALAKAQAEMKNPPMDGTNPAFKGSRYATLLASRDSVLPVMNKHGLAVIQCPKTLVADGRVMCGVTTIIAHSSGQCLETEILLPVEKPNAQGCGSAITYARRYALLAVAGLVGDPDDDGEAASTPPPRPQRGAEEKPKAETAGQTFVREVKAWSGLTDPTDVNGAARSVMAKAGVAVEKGGKLTPEQLAACVAWMDKHKFEELNG